MSNLLPQNFETLITEAEKLKLYTKLVEQLNKDLLLANIDLNLSLDILPESLKYLLHDCLYNLIQEKFAEYLNLLYIVDVSEQKIKSLDGSDMLLLSKEVTFLILQREWQKVWFRHKYS